MAARDDGGWAASAGAWLRNQGDSGDWGRREVLDPVMLPLALKAGSRFVDIGCGEGRFSRMLAGKGLSGSGIDPTEAFIAEARRRDPQGDYHLGRAESLPFADQVFDLAVFYLSLIDIPRFEAAIAEAVRVLKPGGRVLLANMSSIDSARVWRLPFPVVRLPFAFDRYMERRRIRLRWRGMDIDNWHRPYSDYFAEFLRHGLALREFLEPLPQGSSLRARSYRRSPWFVVMEWEKPA
jgi:SAM-dependent methyltransferase